MNFAFVAHSSGLYGADRSLYDLVATLAQRKDMTINVFFHSPGPLLQRLRSAGVSVHVIPYDLWATFPWERNRRAPLRVGSERYLLQAERLARALHDTGAELVVSNTMTVPTGAFAARLLELPHIWHIREFGVKDHGLLFDLGFVSTLRLIDDLSDRVIVNAKAVFAEHSQWIEPSKIRIVYNAIDIPQPGYRARDWHALPFTAVLVGNKSPGKGQEDAVRATALLVRKRFEVRLLLVGGGDPDYVRYLEDLAEALGVREHVEFIGFSEDPYRYYEDAHVALLCSRNEAFSRVVGEAMKLGRPVIGSRSGGTPEQIQPDITGLLYEPGDFVDLASCMCRLYERRDLAESYGRNAAIWANSSLTLDKYVSGFMHVVAEVYNAKSTGQGDVEDALKRIRANSLALRESLGQLDREGETKDRSFGLSGELSSADWNDADCSVLPAAEDIRSVHPDASEQGTAAVLRRLWVVSAEDRLGDVPEPHAGASLEAALVELTRLRREVEYLQRSLEEQERIVAPVLKLGRLFPGWARRLARICLRLSKGTVTANVESR